MKKLSLYSIRDKAVASGRMVFSVQQLANLIGRTKRIAKVYFSRLVNAGLATRLIRGRISFTDDDFIIASELVEPSYISSYSALLFHGISQQVPKYVECVTTKNTLKYPKLGLVYHKIPTSLFYGYRKHKKGNSYIFVAEPEKALIDGLYLGVFSEKDLQRFEGNMKKEKLREFASRFKGKGSKKLRKMIK